ncbi:MAG: UbiA family prenyltransferase [Planctomycetota bacterium]
MSRARAWLELGRISNLPTVWSNVVHGLSAAVFVSVVLPLEEVYGLAPGAGPTITGRHLGQMLDQGFVLLVGMSLLYVGGMVLNDVCDAAVDAVERPGRPIPSGRVSKRSALFAASAMLTAGWGATLVYAPVVSVWAGVLVAAVVGYNVTRRWPGGRFGVAAGFVLMPACRGLVVWIAASAVTAGVGLGDEWLRVLGGAGAVMCYTLIVSLVAWGEANPGTPTLAKLVRWVGVMIALMPVVDALFVWRYGMVPMAVFCLGCAALSLAGQRFVAGS